MKVSRLEVERAHGREVSEFVWESLCREAVKNYEWLGRDFTLDDALGLLRSEASSSPRRRTVTTEALDRRGEALGAWAHRGIGTSLNVRRWRQRRGVMTVDELHREVLEAVDASEELPAHKDGLHWVQFTGDGEVEWWRPVPMHSWLADLADCAAEVAAEYRMLLCDATIAVACDVGGFVQPVITRHEQRDMFAGRWTPAGPLSRIVLEVDPMTPPEVVASAYRNARAERLPGPRRIMGERMLRLAAFMAVEATVIDGPRWRYERSFVEMEHDWRRKSGEGPNPNFARDARQSVRLIHQG